MNKRQKKKQQKKKYGMHPRQYEKWLQDNWPDGQDDLKQRMEHWAEEMKEVLRIAGEMIRDGLRTMAEEIQTEAGFIETDNMLRKSSKIPEGTDKELLKHIGIRMDRYGWAYDFYYDEANEEYFVEILQEGGCKDGTVDDDTEDDGNGMPDSDCSDSDGDSVGLPGSSSEEPD